MSNNLHRDSVSEIRRQLQQHNTPLKEIAANTRNLRAHGVEAPASILGTDEPNGSIFSQLIGAERDGEHSLETTLLNTDVYSKACSSRLRTDMDEDEGDDEVYEDFEEDVNKAVDEEFGEDDACTVTEDIIDTPTVAMMVPEIQTSLQKLHVSSILAFTLADHLPCSSDEVLFEQSQWFVDITRLSENVYQGRDTTSKYGVKRVGQFDRAKVARPSRTLTSSHTWTRHPSPPPSPAHCSPPTQTP